MGISPYSGGVNFLGVFIAFVPTAMILTVSFFVLFALEKVNSNGLKIFGKVVVSLLWIAALAAFSTGISVLAKGKLGICCPMMEKQSSSMGKMQGKDLGMDMQMSRCKKDMPMMNPDQMQQKEMMK